MILYLYTQFYFTKMTKQDLYKKMCNASSFFLIGGPCVVENEENVMRIADFAVHLTAKLGIPYIFKASYKKANRSKLSSFSGIGDEKALRILEKVKHEFGIPVTSDVHETNEMTMVADVLDVIQIPAFLCRQTDLLVAAAKTDKIVNIKKGQFLSPEAMQFAAAKVVDSDNDSVILTERGTTFGYQNLVVDMRSIPKMQSLGFPVVMDSTHSLQEPNQLSGVTGGDPSMIQTIVNAAIASGANGIFMEFHPHPEQALSDGANMLHMSKLEAILKRGKAIYEATHSAL